jgi:hypothetical protein
MWQVLESFEERVQEVEKYLRVLEKLEAPSVVLFDKSTGREKRVFEEGSLKVMKATVFLLLYNLIESSIRSAFGELYKSVINSGMPAHELTVEFRKLWIKQRFGSIDLDSACSRTFRELTEALIEELTQDLPIDLDEDKLPVSGNLDSDAIRHVCRFHGINLQIHTQAFGGGELRTVKRHRNALAHGNTSFSDCGQQYAVSDLQRIKRQAVIFVRGVLKSVDKFISSNGYAAK